MGKTPSLSDHYSNPHADRQCSLAGVNENYFYNTSTEGVIVLLSVIPRSRPPSILGLTDLTVVDSIHCPAQPSLDPGAID